ncbi:MAG: hypothetical protein WC029_02615 [Sulfuricella sp.]|jgi:hypothetical protein
MKLPDISAFAQLQKLARDSGIKESAPHASQTVLIRKIQALRGDDPCFATDKSVDCAEICQWRRNCRKLKAVWLR